MSSIPSYTRPQDSITQILRATAVQVANRRNALVIGPQYKLLLNDGRALPKYVFDSAGAESAYQDLVSGVNTDIDTAYYVPVQAGFKLYGEGLSAVVTPSAVAAFARSGTSVDQIRLSANNVYGGTLNAGLVGRSVAAGDLFVVTATNADASTNVFRRRVLSLLPKKTAASTAALRRAPGNSADSIGLTTTVAGTYTGTIDRTYVLECTASVTGGDALSEITLTVYDTAGIDATTNIVCSGSAQALGSYGLTVAFALAATKSVDVGDKFYLDVTAATEVAGEYNGVKLDGPILNPDIYGAGSLSVLIHQDFNGEITNLNVSSGDAIAVSSSGWSYGVLGLSAEATRRTDGGFSEFEDAVGHVVPSFKAVVIPSPTEGVISIRALTDIAPALGENHPENWAAKGAYETFEGGQSQRIYVLRTAGDTVEDVTVALNKIRTNDTLYSLVALTDDQAVRELVAAHCVDMSSLYKRNFRRSYFGIDSPGKFLFWGALQIGGLRRATLAGGVLTVRAEDRAYSNFLTDASVGDTITMVGITGELTISAILPNGYEVVVSGASGVTVPTASGVSLYHADTPANTVKYLKAKAAALSNRRAALVWTDNGLDGTEVISNKFLASEIAGLRVALLPQQGLTMTEVHSITSAPSMYTRFTPEQLDEISAAGVMVVTQESAGGEVFIRHQLTTETEEGSLAYEDNVGVIVDTFSFLVKDKFRGYTGKRNVTRDTREDIEVGLKQLALDATKSSLAAPDIGPLIVDFFNEQGVAGEVTVRADALLADHITTYTKLRVPLPLNGIDHFIDVEASVGF